MVIHKTCPFCGHEFMVNIPEGYEIAYLRWVAGVDTIQKLLPVMSATARECLISGICPTCQDEFFGKGD